MEYRKILYDRYRATHFGWINPDEFVDRVSEFEADYGGLLPEDRAARILDVGCGMGHFLRYLRARGCRDCVGVDISPDQVAFCRAQGLDNVELVEDLFRYLEAHAGTFELVTMNDVLEHFTKDEIVRLLILTKGALKPGGRIVVRTPNISCAYGPYGRYIDFTHEIVFSELSLKQVLLAVGFEDVVVRGNRVALTLRPKRILLLLVRRIWFSILKLIYLIEAGMDRPTIYTKVLVASGRKEG